MTELQLHRGKGQGFLHFKLVLYASFIPRAKAEGYEFTDAV